MALYAFEGTWNDNQPDDDKDTNVRKFYDAYTAVVGRKGNPYKEGPGTRYGVVGSILGGLFGAGGKPRVNEAYKLLSRNFKQGDKEIDIIGFSRGAAIALDFANKIADEGVNGEQAPPIRFLGLWDTVASFGIPGNPINIGFKLTAPRNVLKCVHALALDEQRRTFRPERLTKNPRQAAADGRILEVWFRGVHSDVGGGYKERKLSSITLCWMFGQARRCGLALDQTLVDSHSAHLNDDEVIHGQPKYWMEKLVAFVKDPLPDEARKVEKDDLIHVSVTHPPKGIARIDDAGNFTV